MPTQLNLFDMFGNPAFGESEHISTEDTLPSKIRLIELFAGVGTQAMALRDIGADFEHHLAVDFDQDAINSYNAIHGTRFPTYDITKLHAVDLNITDTDKYHYIMCYSFPCGLAGTKIKTSDGYRNIEDIKVGDMVLTHNNRYCSVVKTMSRVSDHYNIIKVNGYPELKLTDNHPMYVLRNGKKEWVAVKDLKLTDMVCYNVNCNEYRLNLDDSMLWLLGRYVADGYLNKYAYNSVNFSIAFKKENEFLKNIPPYLKDRFVKFPKKCWDYRIADKDVKNLCKEFRTGSAKKYIPEWLLNAPREQILPFLNGYFSGDGHLRTEKGKTNIMMFTTVSKELFLGLQSLIAKSYGVVCTCSIRRDNRKSTFNDNYSGQFSVLGNSPKQKKIDNQIFTPINQISHIVENVNVYNMEVEDDNSYTCENIVVHNCTDLSVAGKQGGMEEDSGTRSSLLWEVRRILTESLTEHRPLPQTLIMENVTQVHGSKNLVPWQKWLDFLHNIGYHSNYCDMNAKDYGIAQSRNRTIMVSRLNTDTDFIFPEKIPLVSRMKDYLESNVDDRYYLYSDKAKTLISNLVKEKKLNFEKESECVDKSVNYP